MERDELKKHLRIRSPTAKLTEERVRALLEIRDRTHRSLWAKVARDLAPRFGVSKDAILNVFHRRTWAHVRRQK